MATRSFSLEFFPPRSSDAQAQFDTALAELGALAPDYFSVTFGAGGATQDGTPEAIGAILAAGHEAAPHISCIGTRNSDVRALLERYAAMGVRRLVALRGDLPSGHRDLGDFHHADELVRFIRSETADRFHVEVAGYPEFHPESRSPRDDLRHFAAKVAAGADGVITQYFYNVDAYLRFVDDASALGVTVPIVPGIMPITNYRQLARFSDRCGAELPRWLRMRLEGFGEDLESLRAFGHDVVVEMARRLLEAGAPGLHVYTLNRAAPTVRLWHDLGLGQHRGH